MAAIAIPIARRLGALRRPDGGFFIMAGAVLVVAYLALFPLGLLAYSSISSEPPGKVGPITLDNFQRALTGPLSGRVIGNTFLYAAGTTVLSFVVGVGLAWLIVRTNIPFKGLFFTLGLVPLLIPGILHTIGWIFLLSPRIGILNRAAMDLFGLEEAPFVLYSIPGMIWVESLSLIPLVFLLLYAAFQSMDPALEESATMSGSGTLATLRRITLPLMLPAAFAALLITFVRALESFEVPLLLGLPERIYVFTSVIFTAVRRYPSDFGLGGAFAVLLLGLTAVGVYIYGRLTARGERFSTVTGRGFRPGTIDLGGWRFLFAGIFLAYFLLSAGLPVLVLIWTSLLPFYQVPSLEALSRVSLNNYLDVLQYPNARTALRNTLLLAVGTPLVVLGLTSVVAWIVVKTRLPGRRVLDAMAFAPIVFPGLILGIGLIWVYLVLPLPVSIYGTLWILLVAKVTRFMPYGIRACSASLIQIHKELEEASTACGASWLQTFRRVTLPLLRPTLLTAGIYIAILSIREFSTAGLLYTNESVVLSILIWELWDDGVFPQLAALGVMMIVGLSALVFALQRLGGRFGARLGGAG